MAYGPVNVPSNCKSPPDFENLLAWPGCIKATPPKNGSMWVEKILTKADKRLQAEKITVRTEMECTETYRFYYADGVTLKELYVVHTWQDKDGVWYEEITQKKIEKIIDVFVKEEALVINMSGDIVQGELLLLNTNGCTTKGESLIFDTAKGEVT